MASKGGRGKNKGKRQRGQEHKQYSEGLEEDGFPEEDQEEDGHEEEGKVNKLGHPKNVFVILKVE